MQEPAKDRTGRCAAYVLAMFKGPILRFAAMKQSMAAVSKDA
jgi:hypothetical protein